MKKKILSIWRFSPSLKRMIFSGSRFIYSALMERAGLPGVCRILPPPCRRKPSFQIMFFMFADVVIEEEGDNSFIHTCKQLSTKKGSCIWKLLIIGKAII